MTFLWWWFKGLANISGGALVLEFILLGVASVDLPFLTPLKTRLARQTCWTPLRAWGSWLNTRVEAWHRKRDPSPYELQYLLRLAELWCVFASSGDNRKLEGNSAALDAWFWRTVLDGAYISGMWYPPGWKKIVKELR